MRDFRIVLYTLAGVIAGIGVGLFLAPSTGREMRYRLRYSAGKLGKRLGIDGDQEFSDSEMEMDATNGRRPGF